MVFNKTKLHQFGSFVFNQEESSLNLNYGFKTQLDSSVAVDGSIRNNGISQDKKDDYNLSFDVSFKSYDDFNHFKSLINSGPQKLWIKRQVLDTTDFLWQWATVTKFSESFKESNDTFDGETFFTFSVDFRLIDTCWRLEKDPFYYDFEKANIVRYDSGVKYDSGARYDSVQANSIRYVIPDIWKCEGPRVELQSIDYYFRLEKDPKIKNLFRFSNNLTNAAWTKTNVTAALNSTQNQNFNNLASLITVTSTTPGISQIISSIKGKITYQFDIKQGTVGNASHFIAEQSNATDGLVGSGLIAINSGLPVGNGFFRHKFSRVSTIQGNNTLNLRFRTSTDTNPTVSSTVALENQVAYNYYYDQNFVLPADNLDSTLDFNFDNRNALSLVLNSNNAFITNTKQWILNQNKESPLVSILVDNMTTGDTISFINQSNAVGFKFTWLKPNSGKLVIFPNQFRVYQGETLLNPINSDYKIENIPGLKLGLTTNYKNDYNQYVSSEVIDNLQIQKTSSSNISILINQNLTSH